MKSATAPTAYSPKVEEHHPGALASQWIPMDEQLWKVEKYRDFLAARRELLAKAANTVLDELLHAPARIREPRAPARRAGHDTFSAKRQ